MVTTTISFQNRMDSTPSRCAGSRSVCTLKPVRQARRVYSGLVPMSPYTTPSAPMMSAARDEGACAPPACAPGDEGTPAVAWLMMWVLDE
ncbi:hypothetical protein G6F50_018435 [Rhizopus delemar]|uniref:Uncharacterized protein n=1 Tax=Rhizopus delemar TaxID=936053 RepID=A0A9P7BZD0_9FUNG|nr:hypothetical protein G6F50_018435 [Rhizopus delemar]